MGCCRRLLQQAKPGNEGMKSLVGSALMIAGFIALLIAQRP
jgi:hypothetical protein